MTDAPDAPNPRPARPATHPRIHERREQVKRDEGRRRLRIAAGAGACVVIAAASYGITRSPLLDVDRVHVRGATRTTPASVVDASGLGAHPPLTDVDERDVAAAVERLPWVASAEVVRRWPGTVEVTLLERTPVAAVAAGEARWAVVDVSGRVLEVREGDAGELLQLTSEVPPGGPGTRVDPATRGALQLVAVLPEVLAPRVPSAAVAKTGAVELRLDGKIPVHVGPPRQIGPKLVALTTLVQKADLRRVRTIDVRVPSAPVLTRG